jgi:hypothetical protein
VPISHWTTVFAMDVPLEFTQDESGSASFGISAPSRRRQHLRQRTGAGAAASLSAKPEIRAWDGSASGKKLVESAEART